MLKHVEYTNNMLTDYDLSKTILCVRKPITKWNCRKQLKRHKHNVIIRTANKIERFSAVNVNTNVLTKRTLNQSSERTQIITL